MSALILAGCGNSSISSIVSTITGNNGGNPPATEKRTFTVSPGDDATSQMQAAMVQLLPGDTLHFDCGYYELSATLLVSHTEDVTVEGCDSNRDKTVLSFKTSNTPEGILAVNVRGLTVKNLTVLDTGGNGVELRTVEYGKIENVRAIWSSGGGRYAPDASKITASNYAANNYKLLHVQCTDPATLDPTAPENQFPGADTSSPDYTVSPKSGRYGIYPVSSEKIWVTNSESIGASDAGIYVGQTTTALIENSRSAYNVFGMEIENVRGGEYNNNVSECNTGGFLVYDLDNLRQYGYGTVMKGNKVRMNNTYNFTAGGFVGNVPAGSGMITLSYDRVDVHDNEFTDNNTAGIIHASYELFPEGAGRPTENKIDWYTEGLHIYHNTFKNSGNKLPLPTTTNLQSQDLAKLLPAIFGLKTAAACLIPTNLAQCLGVTAAGLQSNPTGVVGLPLANFRGAHIVWDGLLDTYHGDCAYPKNADGSDVATDPMVAAAAPGKPMYNGESRDPGCHYNKYKFDTTKAGAPRLLPQWYSCIDDDNTFSPDSITFSNFHGLKGLEPVIAAAGGDPTKALAALPATDLQNFAASLDRSPHQCDAKYGKNLDKIPEVDMVAIFAGFQRSGAYDPAPSAAQIAALCSASVPAGQVNFNAANVNCPTLDQYNLFKDAQDPTSAPNGNGTINGVPFSLNTKLFSDYAVKYRVLYLPPGQKATYKDKATGAGTNGTIAFPVGTIIAKTFSFRDKTKGTEDAVETRLIIKRNNSKNTISRWDGMAYIWTTENGKRVAKLAMGGGTASVSWDYLDANSGTALKGSTNAYGIPNAGQCQSCHFNDDKEPGAAPIGPKVRNLNGPYHSDSDKETDQSKNPVAGKNQIEYWCSNNIMDSCPTTRTLDTATQILTNLERLPIFNKVGDGNNANPKSANEVEARARAYLEVNCEHCHNDRGYASSTGLFLDSFRNVDIRYGVCKTTTATGTEGRGGHTYDIVPGSGADSIIVFRTGPNAQTPSARMPPIARTVSDMEGNNLLNQWITDVVNKTYTDGACGVK